MMLSVPKGYLKFGGWVLLLGGVMGVAGQLVHLPDTPASLGEIPEFVQGAVNTHVLLAWASILLLMGMPAIYLRQASGLKKWGWFGFPLLFIGMILEIFHGPFQILAYPIIFDRVQDEATLKIVNDQINNLMIDQHPLTLAVLIPLLPGVVFGLLLLGIATLKAKVFPKWIGILTLVVLGLLMAGRFTPDINVFPVIHLMFAAFGGVLIWGGKSEAVEAGQAAAA